MGSEEERKEEDTAIGYRKHSYDTLNPPSCQSERQVQGNPEGIMQRF